VRRPAREVTVEDQAEISAVLRYLIQTHGTGSIAPWFADPTARRAVAAAGVRGRESNEATDQWGGIVATRMGVPYVLRTSGQLGTRHFSYIATEAGALPLRGYDYLVAIGDSITGADSSFAATWSRRPFAVQVLRQADTLLVVPLDSMFARLRAASPRRNGPPATLPPDLFVTEVEGRGARVRIHVRLIAGQDSAGTARVESVAGRVLLALKR
jgi:hypothetical protein